MLTMDVHILEMDMRIVSETPTLSASLVLIVHFRSWHAFRIQGH